LPDFFGNRESCKLAHNGGTLTDSIQSMNGLQGNTVGTFPKRSTLEYKVDSNRSKDP